MPSVQTLQHQLRRAGAPASVRLLHRRDLLPLTTVVASDEQILDAALGTYQGRHSIVLITDRRCVVASGPPQRPAVTFVPFAAIRSVSATAEFLVGSLTLHLAEGELTISEVSPGGYTTRIASHIAAQAPPA